MTGVIRCDYCKEPVDPSAPETYQRVVGWESRSIDPSRKGGRDITLREHLNLFACDLCIGKVKAGVSIHQEVLL